MERAFYRGLATAGRPHRSAEALNPGTGKQGYGKGSRPETQAGPNLLALLSSMEDMAPLRAIVGLGQDGRPLLVDFSRPTSWHLIAVGPQGSGKSSLLRTLMLSLALASRRSEVRFVGIELETQELVPIEALPHTLADLAASAEDALGVLDWTAEEVSRRIRAGFLWPHIFLFVEALDRLLELLPARAGLCIDRILSQGATAGIHIIASMGRRVRRPAAISEGDGIIHAQAERYDGPGSFQLSNRHAASGLQAAHLSAWDLDRAVHLAQAGWRVSRPVPMDKGADFGWV